MAWFSRQCEYRADHGGATLSGKQNMINALRRLGGSEESTLPASMAAFGLAVVAAASWPVRSHRRRRALRVGKSKGSAEPA